MDRLIELLERSEPPARVVGTRAQRAERVRKEPTISG
jgi:hypothetical protein